MRARLKAKVLRWKSTAMQATKSRRLLQARLQRSQRRVAELENKVALLEAQSAPILISGHTYPAQLIALAVFIVVQANGSLRCDVAGGAAYAAAVDLAGVTSYDFTVLMQGTQYTVRVYNGSDACFTDYPITTTTVVCMPTSCELALTAITPVCTFASDETTFTLDLTVNTIDAPAGEDLIVSVNGNQVAAMAPDASGTTTFTGISLTEGISYGNTVMVNFATTIDCSAAGVFDLIACTPDCVTAANTIGGNVFQDTDNDGADAGAMEAGQENVLVQVYDCDGNLACEV